jgi:glycosyltransferase involved in cell wall biosynthesis
MAINTTSVAMATYNGAKYIRQQLLSIAHQTKLPSELVVSDDASSDDTLEIISQFAEDAPFAVRIISNPANIGYVRNFGIALAKCTGDIVFLSDQDDFWWPEKIETMMSWFAEHDEAELLIHDLKFCSEDLTSTSETKMQRMRRLHDVERDYVVGMATAIRSRFLKQCLPIPEEPGLTHDRWLHMCAESVDRKRLLPAVLALHRRHATNVTINNPVNAAGRRRVFLESVFFPG